MTSLDEHGGRQIRPGKIFSEDHNKPAVAVTPRSEERVLEEFDLDYAFGPSNGISRLMRWERAQRLCLNPPEEVRRIILQHGSDSKYNESLWNRHISGIK
ncbi:DNA polymerase delta subunit 4 [Geodia barretti]|uniref:DNA polymerase delta subunit 4 n=1 Tax=Geodia barretti TaxID=519541 RepID=A0AA35WR91_GEOBA|nr:DNA polymerase delta subunit 4 [Geodia barretti]